VRSSRYFQGLTFESTWIVATVGVFSVRIVSVVADENERPIV
jgi:hypothetical protein